MGRLSTAALAIFLGALVAIPALAQEGDADESGPAVRIIGDQAPEPIANDEESSDGEATAPADEQQAIVTGYVGWDFAPIIEVTHARGAVSQSDAQRTLNNDRQGIGQCFSPQSYPGVGTVRAEIYLAYNGVPKAVNGTTDGVVRPNQARCILRRAWNYEFPRLAADADQDTHIKYRVHFAGQPQDVPPIADDQAAHLIERLQSERDDLEAPLAGALTKELPRTEHCAQTILRELPGDFLVSAVAMTLAAGDGATYAPTDVNITVKNHSSADLPSQTVLDCYRRALVDWRVDLSEAARGQETDLPPRIAVSFFLTLRPPAADQLSAR